MLMQSLNLDRVFQALGDPTRRAVLERLSSGSAPVSELAQPFNMALPSFLQHLSMLENCGLVQSCKTGRVRTYKLVPQSLQVAESWITEQRTIWNSRLEQLDDYLLTIKDNKQESDDD